MNTVIPIEPARMRKSGQDNKKFVEIAPGKHIPASLSVRKLEKRILRLTANAITEYDMICEGDKVLVAMSGGKDSYVLLDALRKLQARAPVHFELLAVHVDQHIPNNPTHIIEQYLEGIGLPYHIEAQDTHSINERLIPSGKNVCSLCARLRRGILYRVAREHGCTKIALGHQMDDVAETLLMKLRRMSLCGIREKSEVGPIRFVRPLLGCRDAELKAYLRKFGEEWREDVSNEDTSIERNRIRHEVIPFLEKTLDPHLVRHLATIAARQ